MTLNERIEAEAENISWLRYDLRRYHFAGRFADCESTTHDIDRAERRLAKLKATLTNQLWLALWL